jgi:hypothetical protein
MTFLCDLCDPLRQSPDFVIACMALLLSFRVSRVFRRGPIQSDFFASIFLPICLVPHLQFLLSAFCFCVFVTTFSAQFSPIQFYSA